MVTRALVVAAGVKQEGRREVLGLACGLAETEAFWTELLRGLTAQGLTGVRLVISDAHQGLKNAAAKVMGVTWRPCRTEYSRSSTFMRNALAYVPKSQNQTVAAVIRTAFVRPTREEAVAQWRETADCLRQSFESTERQRHLPALAPTRP